MAGNEKVVRPRLTDAEFFFNQDKKSKLEGRNERLKSVVFQAQLGTVYEKAERVPAKYRKDAPIEIDVTADGAPYDFNLTSN